MNDSVSVSVDSRQVQLPRQKSMRTGTGAATTILPLITNTLNKQPSFNLALSNNGSEAGGSVTGSRAGTPKYPTRSQNSQSIIANYKFTSGGEEGDLLRPPSSSNGGGPDSPMMLSRGNNHSKSFRGGIMTEEQLSLAVNPSANLYNPLFRERQISSLSFDPVDDPDGNGNGSAPASSADLQDLSKVKGSGYGQAFPARVPSPSFNPRSPSPQMHSQRHSRAASPSALDLPVGNLPSMQSSIPSNGGIIQQLRKETLARGHSAKLQ
jgi:hypothetical protein